MRTPPPASASFAFAKTWLAVAYLSFSITRPFASNDSSSGIAASSSGVATTGCVCGCSLM
jgi:hypothetical protein